MSVKRARYFCRVPGCGRARRHGHFLMCGWHWHLVPVALKQAVRREFKKDRRSEDYYAQVEEAIAVTVGAARKSGVRPPPCPPHSKTLARQQKAFSVTK